MIQFGFFYYNAVGNAPKVSFYPAPSFRDNFNTDGNLNGRTNWTAAYLAGQAAQANAVAAANGKAGGTTGTGMFAITTTAVNMAVVKRRMAIGQIPSGTLIDHATFTPGGGVSGFILDLVNSASGKLLNALMSYRKYVNNVITGVTSQAGGRGVAGDNYRTIPRVSGADTVCDVFHNGWKLLDSVVISGLGITLTGQSGIKGNIGTGALDEIEIADSTAEDWIGLRWGTRVLAFNADGSVTIRFDVVYNLTAPSTLVYSIFDLSTGSEVALVGHDNVRKSTLPADGRVTFTTNVSAALLASNGPFVARVVRDRMQGGGESHAWSPQWRWGIVELSGGQSLRIGMSTQTFTTTDAYAPPANGQHTLGTPQSSATLGAENLRYTAAIDTNCPVTAWQAALAAGGYAVATASGGISATPIATRGVGTACHAALKECLDRHLRRANFIGWMDGQSDIGDDTSAYQAALLAISQDLETYCGYIVPIKLEPVAASWRGSSFHDIRWQLMRRTQWKLCQDYPTRFFYGAHALDIQHDTGSNGILHPSPNGYGVLGTRSGKRTKRLLGLLAHDPNGPSLASVAKVSSSRLRCVYNLNGWDSLSLVNSAYAGDFNGGMLFSNTPALTSTTVSNNTRATAATVDAAPAGGQQGIEFDFAGTPWTGTAYIRAAWGMNPFNPFDNGTNTDPVNLDLAGKASMIQGVKAGELNTALQPYFTADGLDYMTAA